MQSAKQPQPVREFVLADLARAQRLILQIKDELDSQFRIASPEGDYWIAMTLDADLTVRARQMQMLSRFMTWKLSTGFTMATVLQEPDAVYAIAVTHKVCVGAL